MPHLPRPVPALAILAMILAAPVSAQTAKCAARDKVVERLASSFGETRRSIGLARDSAVMELFASDTTGTWTITVTLANGMTCLVASGQSFETLSEDLPVADQPT
jgi:hypothetical protein